ncbi:hypothetical protein E4U43_008128 [Claviceps pusilla]|uniref:BTB domain-containing protein n=1 Tax=Claviceps pusilla TaxID=123648 RepID=A0A9P7NBV9_9HYPO|nr:hypothetical protein E4U43_008128 [Claviceps pusilla]
MSTTSGAENMEEGSYASFMASKPFEFVVGPEKKVFAIHSALVASQSAVLERLVNGDMKEAKEGSAVLEHVDEQTFIRFSQYAYMGIYRYPSYRPGPPHNADSDNNINNNQDGWMKETEAHCHKCRYCGKRCYGNEPRHGQMTKGKKLWNDFEKQLSSSEPYMVMKTASRLNDGEENDAELLLCHAKLYVFADSYGIEPLMKLSLSTLHYVLVKVSQSNDMASMAVKLLLYCYENDTPEALREIVVEYAACRVEHLWGLPQFQELLQTFGEFSMNLVKALLGRID